MHTRTIPGTTKALAAVAVALVAALSGCSGDDYYCDATQCYYCDSVGCSPVAPPTRATCHGDFECAANQVCTDLGCATTCATDAECARGWICRGASGTTRGICVAPRETPTRTPGSCRSNTDCPSGTICVDGACARPRCDGSTTSCTCTADAQCTGGQVCVGGRCTAASNTCQFNSQCGAGRVCVNQQCRVACPAAPCPAGQTCSEGVCVDRPAGECVRDTDCGTGRRCINSTCYTRCTSNAMCMTGLYCNDDGVCAPDTRRRPFCASDAQCATGSRCLDGLCRRPCAGNDDCQRTDVSYRNCGPIAYLHTTDRYCQTDHEFAPMCARAADCAAGQSCVDAVCRSATR